MLKASAKLLYILLLRLVFDRPTLRQILVNQIGDITGYLTQHAFQSFSMKSFGAAYDIFDIFICYLDRHIVAVASAVDSYGILATTEYVTRCLPHGRLCDREARLLKFLCQSVFQEQLRDLLDCRLKQMLKWIQFSHCCSRPVKLRRPKIPSSVQYPIFT